MYQPIPASSRIQMIDALRGFCLLGIILANIPAPEQSVSLLFDSASLSKTAQSVMHVLVSTKFITIFSILFGFGFSVQLNRAAEKNIHFRKYFFIRMVILFFIGCVHAYLCWFGDIIRYYAVCGMLLLLFHQISTKRLLRLSLVFIIIITALVFILNSILELQVYSYDYSIATKIFSAETYSLYLLYNYTIDPMVNFIQDSPLTFASCFGKILFGYWLGRIGFFQKDGFDSMVKKWLRFGFVVGFIASVLFWAVSKGFLELDLPLLWLPFLIAGGLFLHSLFYLALFIRVFKTKLGKKLLLLFSPVGRMALSNYLVQTLFYLFLFYKWIGGPTLYGKLSTLETYGLALLLFLLQTCLSHLWLKRFSQGPIEWMWKTLAYRFVKTNPKEDHFVTLQPAVEGTITMK